MHSAYVYSYPHKLAYGPLEPKVELAPLWRREERDQLFLYWHIPFCEMRCGFCNLFTAIEHSPQPMQDYLQALRRQALQMAELVHPCMVTGLAIGGGTPTQLPIDPLAQLLEWVGQWPRSPQSDFSLECSPATAGPDKLHLLRQAGVTRLSIGVQSFVEAETEAVHRPQSAALVARALDDIRAQGFAVLNIDLMLGLPGQTPASLKRSLQAALRWQPEELYLYPLYVRPLTRLYRHYSGRQESDLYRVGRDYLQEHGYQQVSLRMYRRVAGGPGGGAQPPLGHRVAGGPGGGEYRSPLQPMLGLGCGARSYTRELHYSTPYAVGTSGVGRILREYRETEDFRQARFGYWLDKDEQRRRRAILSLLSEEGMEAELYAEFSALLEAGEVAERRLTPLGRERADHIGPRFFSSRVSQAVLAGSME